MLRKRFTLFWHVYVANAICSLLAHICPENDLHTPSGKFLRVKFCRSESFDFLCLCPTVGLMLCPILILARLTTVVRLKISQMKVENKKKVALIFVANYTIPLMIKATVQEKDFLFCSPCTRSVQQQGQVYGRTSSSFWDPSFCQLCLLLSLQLL